MVSVDLRRASSLGASARGARRVREGRRLPDVRAACMPWLPGRGWALRRHQLGMVDAAREGTHLLLGAGTGAGKTLAGFLPTLADLVDHPREGLQTPYISPLKALAVDVQRNLMAPTAEMGLPLRVETRRGHTQP